MMPRGQRYITWHKCYFYLHVCYLTGYLGMCHSGATALVYTMIYKKIKHSLLQWQLDKPISRSSIGYFNNMSTA